MWGQMLVWKVHLMLVRMTPEGKYWGQSKQLEALLTVQAQTGGRERVPLPGAPFTGWSHTLDLTLVVYSKQDQKVCP